MIPASVRIFVCTTPQDMRRSFDGLAAVAFETLGEDPQGGAVFVFVNKRANRIKAIWFEQSGYCILYKRGHNAIFPPPRSTERERPVALVNARELARLFRGVHHPPRTRIKWHDAT
jgi:transposase